MADQNGNDPARAYLDAVQAQLGERVTNLGRRQTDLETEMRTGFRTIEQSIASLTTSLSERNKPQWQALSVMLAFAAILGGLAYMPIREATSDLKSAVATIAANSVTRQEMDWRSARSAEDRIRTDDSIKEIRSGIVYRNEWQERNLSRDHEIASIQRQIDQQRSDFQTFSSSLGNGRDFIQDMKTELARLRDRLNEIGSRQYMRPPPTP
jgi:chromosome segregation ATPase